MNDMENLRTFADQLWKYMVPKLDSKFASNVSYFRAEVVSNPGNNKLEVQRPVENGTLTLPCVRAMSGAQAGQQVVALVMGSMSNAIVVGDGNLNVPGGGGDAGIANFQAQPDGSLVITLINGNTLTATPVMDDVPTQGSNLAVKSGGIYTALNGKADKAFANVKVGSTTIAADTKQDTIELVAGSNVTITPDATNDKVTIAAKDTTYSNKAAASGGTDVSLVTTGEKYTWNNLHYKLTDGIVIPEGADLDDATYRTPGNYICETNAKAHTIKHFPGYNDTTLVSTRANAFKLFVGYAQGGSNYIAQELRDYFNGAVYYRWYYSSWSTWRAVRGTASVLISELDTADEDIKDSTLISTSGANGETRIWYRRAATAFWNYIKGKSDAVYAAINHKHAASDINSGTLAAARLPTATASAQGAVKLGASGGAAAYIHTHAANDVTDLVTATAYGPTGLVSFQDAHGGLPLKKCLVSIMPAQSGSGNPTPSNVRPISGREHVKVWWFGKNFFPQADVTFEVHEGNKTVAFPHPLPAGPYTFSADLTSTFDGNCIVHIIRGDGTSIQFSLTPGTRVSASFTSDEGNEITGIRFYVGSNWATSVANSGAWSNVQVETGSTATAYEASETVVDADLPKPVYGGTLDVLTGKLTVTHGYIKPTEYTGSSLSDTMVVVFIHIPLGKRGTSRNVVSNVATGAARTDNNIARYGYVVDQSIVDESPLLFISASTTAHPTMASLSQALLDADACFAYELETPEVYQLTPSQVASLAGQNHIWADCGTISIDYGAFLSALDKAIEEHSDDDIRHITEAERTAWDGKQNALTFDDVPTAGSNNPVKSSGIYNALAQKANLNHTHDAPDITSGILPAARGGTGNGNGYIQIGKKNGTTLGSYATAEGNGTTASGGPAAHAEGNSTSATGNDAPHAEGYYTKASGDYGAHAEGYWTTASGNYGAHAEGHNTVASGDYGAHADGDHTIAAGRSQHVFGVYNISNTTDVEIVGWGSSNARKNIRTLATNGNEWIAGTMTQASDARLKDVQGEIPDLSSIRAVRFRWKNGDDKEHLGYLAQDVEGIAPYLVGVDSNGYKSLDYIALLTAKVEMLEREIKKLKQ